MKSKLTLYSLLAISIALASCKKEEEETEAVTTTKQQPIFIPPVENKIRTENYVQPTQQANTPVQNASQMTAQTPVITKPGMNPPHGQTGHRCDIAVGAPLNSPPGKPAKSGANPGQVGFTQTSITTPTPTSAPTGNPELLKTNTPIVTAPGMNPPHGQEGHRCDIAVGQPLQKAVDSK